MLPSVGKIDVGRRSQPKHTDGNAPEWPRSYLSILKEPSMNIIEHFVNGAEDALRT